MDARRLVGMTMGARKRAAIWMASEPGQPTVKAWLAAYDEARKAMRIGLRLRPCPGCPACRPDDAEECGDGAWILHDMDMPHPCEYSCGCRYFDYVEGYPPPRCKGDGVQPARCGRCSPCRGSGICYDDGGEVPCPPCGGSGFLPNGGDPNAP